MQLASRVYAQNDARIIEISYRSFLREGMTLASFSVTDPTGMRTWNGSSGTSTGTPITSNLAFTPDRQALYFLLTCPGTNQSFTLTVEATDSLGQQVNDIILVTIQAP